MTRKPRMLSFSTLLDIDKLTHWCHDRHQDGVLVLCWILINLHSSSKKQLHKLVLVLCWILINLHTGHGFFKRFKF